MAVYLLKHLPFASNRQAKNIRKRINDRHANPVQATGHFVAVIVKFTSGMEGRHDYFCRRNAFLSMDVDRDPTAVVLDRDCVSHMNRYVDRVAIPRQGLIDRIVDELLNHMM